MAFELTPRKGMGLGACFGVSLLIFLIVIFTAPSASALGILLSGLLILLGAAGYGAVVFICALAIGLLGVGLALLIDYMVDYFKNKSEPLPDSHLIAIEEKIEEEARGLNFVETHTLLPEIDDLEEITEFENWGMEIAITLYEKALERNQDIKVIFQNYSQELLKKYKALALKYHPDRELDESKKVSKTSAFQELGNVYERTFKAWELALSGIDPRPTKIAESTPYKNYSATYTPLSEEEYRLWKEMVREEVRRFYAEFDREAFKAEILADVKAELQKRSFLFWANQKGTELKENITHALDEVCEKVSHISANLFQ